MLANSRLLRISSKDRSAHSGSRYSIDLNTNDNDLHQIKKVTLKSAVIPNTQYNINKHNNILYLPTSVTAVTDYKIPKGQYSTSELIEAVQVVVNAIVGADNLTITQNDRSQKLTIVLNTGTMDIYNTNNSMAYVLGIETESLAVSAYVCDNLPNLTGLNHIYISSQSLSNHTQMITHDKGKQNVFADITMKVCFGQTQYTDEDYVVFHCHKNISRIDIKLMDEHNNELDLNGRDWTL